MTAEALASARANKNEKSAGDLGIAGALLSYCEGAA
jgi:hypothetical protein